MKKINMAILGIGRIGKIHLQNLWRHFPQVQVVAAADSLISLEKLRQDYPQVILSAHAEDVLNLPQVDAVAICTPTSSHAKLIDLCIQYGKHIFCEKPVDLSLARTAELVQKAKTAGIKMMLGFNRRFDPDFLQARKSVQAGRIGKIQIVKITSRDPGLPPLDYIKNSGGLFMDMAIHDFDMARYIMGKEVAEVYARGLVLVDPQVGEAGDIDTALTTLVFEDGTYAVIDNSRQAAYGYDQRLEIFGDLGMIQVENNQHHRNIISDAQGIHHALPLDFFMDRYAASYLNEMHYFTEALTHDKPLPATGEDGLKATIIAVAAKKSADEKRPVKISEINAML